jgi:hypothetical protein
MSPLKPRVECWFGTLLSVCLPSPSCLSLSLEFFHIHVAAAARVPSSPETSPS